MVIVYRLNLREAIGVIYTREKWWLGIWTLAVSSVRDGDKRKYFRGKKHGKSGAL